MNTATDACMFGVDADPFFWGRFPIKRYVVHSFVVVFLFRVYNLEERRARDDEKDAKRVFSSVVILQIECKVDDAHESENREEEKHIARKIESFGGDGFVIVIIIIFF